MCVKLIIKINLHGLASRILNVIIVIYVSLLNILRWNGPRLKISRLLFI